MNRTLNFHKVTNSSWFENVICWLKSGYSLISLSDIQEQSGKNVNTCQLTFDDGDISFYNFVLPVLRKHKVPAALFVSPMICRERSNYWFQDIEAFDRYGVKKIISSVTGIPQRSIMKVRSESVLKMMPFYKIREVLNESRKRLPYSSMPFRNVNILQLKEIDSTGLVTIGAHTLNHPVLRNETDDRSEYEISNSVRQLSDILNHEIKFFAYPNGIPELDFTQREKNFLASCGIRLCFKNESMLSASDDSLSIPRIAISDNESIRLINLKLRMSGLWGTMKKLDPRGEYRERKKLSLMMQ